MIRIEQASQADADIIARLNQHVHRLHLDHVPHFFTQPSEDETRAAFSEILAQTNARAFIAYADETAIGYVHVVIHERPANVFCPARRYLYVDQISVEPSWEGRGIGRQLMQAVKDYARAAGIDELEVDTWAFNDKAQAFFKASGFQPKIERLWMQLDE